jgi:hypothetical protein
VLVLRTAPVSRFFVVTVAAEIGAPDASVTMPVMPAATCARIGRAIAKARTSAVMSESQALFARSKLAQDSACKFHSPVERIVTPPEEESIQYGSIR